MALRQISVKNLQALREAYFDLPEQGLVRFAGPNSNGKSIVTKATAYLIRGDITNPKVRNTLINRSAVAGEITYTKYDESYLTCHLQREASATYVVLGLPGKEPIKRYLADKNWSELVSYFGFKYNADREIMLQVVDDESPLLYLGTSNRVNSDTLDTVLSDEDATIALTQLTDIMKEVRDLQTKTQGAISLYTQAAKDIKIYDVEACSKLQAKLQKYRDILVTIRFPRIPRLPDMKQVTYYDLHYPVIAELPKMTKVTYFDVHYPNISKVPSMKKITYYSVQYPRIPKVVYPMIVDAHCAIPDITATARDVAKIKAGCCPTCGRPWV